MRGQNTSLAMAVAGIALTLMLVGCSDDDKPLTAKTTEQAVSSSAATESTSPAPVVVSLETTCDMYFGDMKKDDLAIQVVDVANAPSFTSTDLPKVEDLADSLRGLSERSQPELRPYLDAQALVLEGFAEDIRSGTSSTHDMQDFKASGLELLQQCQAHLMGS